MARLLYCLMLLWMSNLTLGQEYRVYYQCDFETGDCGLRNVSFGGAFFRHRFVDLGQRRTNCLVLDDLPVYSNWTYGLTRSASVSTPVVFPVYGPLSISLDYYLVKANCVDYLEVKQQYGNISQTLRRVNVPSVWNTMQAVLTNPGQPVKVVVEVRLLPTCQDYLSCQCANTVAIDNLRITSSGGVFPTPRPGPPTNFHQWWQYYHHWIKKLRKTWPPVPPPCPIYEPCNETVPVYIPCPPSPHPQPCPPPPPVEPCPPCPPGPISPECPPPSPCPPIRPCPPIKPCPLPDLPAWDSKPGHNLPPWDPYLQDRQP